MTSSSPKNVIIIGGGIIGVSSAIWLQRFGHQVTIVDREGICEGTSYGNAGWLASCAIIPISNPDLVRKAPAKLINPNQPVFMRWSYLPELLPWVRKFLKFVNKSETRRISEALATLIGDSVNDHQLISEGTGAEKYIKPTDFYYAFDHRSDYESDAFEWGIRADNGFQWEEIEKQFLTEHLPLIGEKFQFALKVKDTGQLTDPGAYVKQLGAYVEKCGGVILKQEVEDFQIDNGVLKGVIVDGKIIECDAAIIATGAWSAQLVRKLSVKMPFETERGYHLEFWEPSEMPETPVMIDSGKFVVTPMEGRIRAAGMVEFGGLEAGPSEAPFKLLEKKFREAYPSITWKRMERWMGHRPSTPDALPMIGEYNSVKGVYAGFGHQHLGITAGPKTGNLLAQLIDGKKPNIDLAPYSPIRFD